MPTVRLETTINAPIEVCFDLARNVEAHCETTSGTQERAVAGVTTGLIGPNDEVTFEAVHFGVRQRLTARIVEYEWPFRFVDEMITGAFKSLVHIHEFEDRNGYTLMTDTLTWTSPLGPIGMLADKLLLESHMRRFLIDRNAAMKRIAERHVASSP